MGGWSSSCNSKRSLDIELVSWEPYFKLEKWRLQKCTQRECIFEIASTVSIAVEHRAEGLAAVVGSLREGAPPTADIPRGDILDSK